MRVKTDRGKERKVTNNEDITRRGSSKEKEGVASDETGATTPSPRRSAAGVKEKVSANRIISSGEEDRL